MSINYDPDSAAFKAAFCFFLHSYHWCRRTQAAYENRYARAIIGQMEIQLQVALSECKSVLLAFIGRIIIPGMGIKVGVVQETD